MIFLNNFMLFGIIFCIVVEIFLVDFLNKVILLGFFLKVCMFLYIYLMVSCWLYNLKLFLVFGLFILKNLKMFSL